MLAIARQLLMATSIALAACSSTSPPTLDGVKIPPSDDAGDETPTVHADAGIVPDPTPDATAPSDGGAPDAALEDVVRLDVAVPDAADGAPTTPLFPPSCYPFYPDYLPDGGVSVFFVDGGPAPADPCIGADFLDAGPTFPFACTGSAMPGNGVVQTKCVDPGVSGISCCECAPDQNPPAAVSAACGALDAGLPAPWGCSIGAAAPLPCTLLPYPQSVNPLYCCPAN